MENESKVCQSPSANNVAGGVSVKSDNPHSDHMNVYHLCAHGSLQECDDCRYSKCRFHLRSVILLGNCQY